VRENVIVAVLAAFVLTFSTGCTRLKRWAYEGFGRDGWQQPERVVETLGLEPGDRVADLGAGGGYFTFRLAEAVGAEGRVYAIDVDKGMIDHLREQADSEGRGNVTVVLAEYDDPLLPEGGVDLIFTSNTYHHIQERTTYFARARRSLDAEGRVAIVEYKPSGWFQKIFPHATSAEEIRTEMEAAGYRLEGEYDFLERQHFMVFISAGG
jgi:ubiquinone/menaquinone biosynthesis C-methylase UbiE